MATARSERPRFFDGQYIGAADLAAAVDYSRELARQLALGGQSWGICIGLDLVEVANTAGGFDYFVLPGLAFDGYGRPIVVLSPAPVPAGLFADFPTGNQQVWLRYDEAQNRGLRPGWQSCDAEDAYARVRESFAIEAGPKAAIKDRQSGLEVAGTLVPDARLALAAISAGAPLLCDASVPHQTYPPDTARWLVPLGVAAWTAGAPGALGERSADVKKLSRSLRRYVGQVAESLYAADGVLRLRDRMTDRDDSKSPDEQCAAASLRPEDLTNAPDPQDPTTTVERLIGNELVWVEGHMRVTGDARLWGTRLELRNAQGAEADVPLYLRRAPTANADGGHDMEIALGTMADGHSRLLAGAMPAGGPLQPKLQLRNDGRLAVGPVIPADVKTHTLLATTEAATSIAINTADDAVGTLFFTIGAALTERAHIAYDDAENRLQILVGTTPENAVTFTTTGHVGIRMDDPIAAHADANDLVIHNPLANPGLTLLGDANSFASIHFADGLTSTDELRAGFIRYVHASNRLHFGTNNAVRATIDAAGDFGIGTETPVTPLHIAHEAPTMRLDIGGGGPAARIEFAVAGSVQSTIVHDGVSQALRFNNDGSNAITLRENRVGINLGTALPANPLHVRGNIAGSANSTGNHVALIENMAGGNADILALRVGGSVATNSNNFITFFDSTGAIGRIERGALTDLSAGDINQNQEDFGTFLRLVSGGADFAESLPRAATHAPIGPGRIVGVKAGAVSLATRGADALLITTDRAVVVGNARLHGGPPAETVAMLGQVPLFVEGPVRAGDYIVPSGHDDGVGRAMRPAELDAEAAGRVVGRAWQDCPENGRRRVLVAVGVGGASVATTVLLAQQAERIAALESRLASLCARLDGQAMP